MMAATIARLNVALEGRYRIQRELGEGGMATVFLAEDVKHGRNVALKVLKPELAAVVGGERFLAEIRTTAQLQHPHILPLHDSGEADSFLFYVMPYIEGESLRERLEREQQLPVEEALGIAGKVAAALQYAHEQGVVHRDIKPANILMSRGEPLVADFGIALAVSQAGGGRITETGLSLGTPHYMSPEQAAGERTLDKRSDVYALGCVLYEMLTGQPPFGGPSAQAVLGRILTGDPDPVTQHRRSVPPNVEAAVHKALERLPADRFESAKAFVAALYDRGFTTTTGTVTRGEAVAGAGWRKRFIAATAAAAILALVAAGGWLRGPANAPDRLVRFSVPLPFPTGASQLAVSPDGSRFAFGSYSNTQMWIREIDDLEVRQVEGRPVQPRFSPDGRSLLTTMGNREVRVTPLGGGPSRTIAESSSNMATAWGDDGYVYFEIASGAGIGRVPAGGGAMDTVLARDAAPATRYGPQVVLPGGRGLLYSGFGPDGGLFVLDLESRESRFIAPADGGRSVAYSFTGHLLYASGRFLVAQPFDLGTLETTGGPVPVAEVPDGTMTFAYGGGTLVYASSDGGTALVPMITDRSGEGRPLSNLGDGAFDFPEVSPDGERVAMQVSGRGGQDDVWIYEMPAGPLTRLSLGGGATSTTWAEGGDDILFIRDGDAYRTRSDGSEEPRLVLDLPRDLSRLALSPDESRLFYQVGPGEWDVGVAPLDGEAPDSLLLAGDYWEGHPTVSPDGRWLAYYSYQAGSRSEVFVQPLHGPGRRHQVSRQGGLRPRWASSGEEIFFAGSSTTDDEGLWVARLEVGEEDLRVVSVERLFDMPTYNYDIFPGDSLLITLQPRDDQDALASELTVVVNFDRVLLGLDGGAVR